MATSEKLEFRTIRGVLAPCDQRGFSHSIIDDYRRNYLIQTGRKSARLDFLIGTRVEVKGLVETGAGAIAKIRLTEYAPMDSFERMQL